MSVEWDVEKMFVLFFKEKKKGELKGVTERTSTDKLRARREKKVRQREKFKRKAQREAEVAKLNPALGNKYAKEKALRQLTKMSEHGDDVTIIQVRPTFFFNAHYQLFARTRTYWIGAALCKL